jgi:subtilase family serine protease
MLAAAAVVLAGATVVSAVTAPTSPGASGRPAIDAGTLARSSIPPSAVVIRPEAIHVGEASAVPPSSAECEKELQIACYDPAQLQLAYNLAPLFNKGINGAGQTIVIVDSYGSPTIGHDLSVFDATFNLPAPPSFSVIQPAGKVPPYTPSENREGWAGEATLDVEYAHVMAPGASILLVETPTSENEGTSGFPQIVKAEEYVIDNHLGGVISQSFSATEETFPTAQSLLALRSAYIDAAAPGNDVTVLAASGDSGATDVESNMTTYYDFPVTSWPDSDPLVTGIGGTRLHLNAMGYRTSQDTVWNDSGDAASAEFAGTSNSGALLASGGGKSIIFSRPSYQDGVADVVGVHRGVPDISMSAACDGAVDAYQSFAGQSAGWYPTCGTSEATPLFAGVVALADQLADHPLGLINPALYFLSASQAPGIVGVTEGTNTVSFTQDHKAETVKGYSASPGYNLATGVGTVNVAKFVPELVAAVAAEAASPS